VDLIADTSFLVGLWRGQRWATSYALENPSKSLALPWIVLGEFWHGARRAGHDAKEVESFLSLGVPIVDASQVISTYVAICSALSDSEGYRNIGQNDLWIASTAVAFEKPLLTRNRRQFDMIEGLRLEVLGE